MRFQKMLLFTILWLNVCKMSVWNVRTLLNFYWVSIVFVILIANISWTVAQTPINHIIFWKTVIKTFRSIYVNCFNRLRFLAEVSTKLQKMHFLDNLRTITQEGSMETRQMASFFHLLFLLYFKINPPFSAVLSFLSIISTLRPGLTKW